VEVAAALADPDGPSLRPWELARLTDWQIRWLYLEPAVQRANKAAGRTKGPGPVADPFEKGLPPRAEFVSQMQGSDGGTAAHWNAVYDRLEAEMKARDGC
jgi:hypothetical protein